MAVVVTPLLRRPDLVPHAMSNLDKSAADGHNYGHHGATEVAKHLRAIDVKHHALVREKIGEQLRFEPAVETNNRKLLRQPAPFGATWEIRFGPDNRFRVLYDIDEEANVVQIMAIGEKQRERLFIGGEEVQL
jgi:mRNA-degrading endonuclease RelE of RelBE toxin-antitoxin system